MSNTFFYQSSAIRCLFTARADKSWTILGSMISKVKARKVGAKVSRPEGKFAAREVAG